jgi:hypothetical protein
MSDLGDYLDEMDRYRTADVDIERLFSGSPQPAGDLAPLADYFARLSDFGDELDDEAVGRVVAIAAAAAAATPTVAPAAPRPQKRFLLSSLRRRVATVTTAVAVLLGGTSGLAFAADGAMPGDSLYGIDRALEAVGIGAGGEAERLGEAEALINAGEVIRGLEHAAETLEEHATTGPNAAIALLEAAERVRAVGSEPSAVTRESVAGLLTYLAENAGSIDGSRVAEMAVQIGRPHTSSSPGQSDPQGPPAGVPADPPGQDKDRNEPGPPEGVPADPPGQNKDKNEPGPPEGVPADPPGQDKDKNEPGPPDSLPNNQP